MTINEALVSYLSGLDLAASVWSIFKPLKAELPAIVVRRVSRHEEQPVRTPGVDRASFDFQVISPRLSECWDITETLISTLPDLDGEIVEDSGLRVGACIYQDSEEDFASDDGSEKGSFFVTSTFDFLVDRE